MAVFSALNGRLWPLLKQIFSYLISAPFITGHPYQFHKVSRFPVRQVHFWRRVTCSTMAVALITPSLLTRPYSFTLWPVSRCFLDVPVLCHLLMRQGWGFFPSSKDFLAPYLWVWYTTFSHYKISAKGFAGFTFDFCSLFHVYSFLKNTRWSFYSSWGSKRG